MAMYQVGVGWDSTAAFYMVDSLGHTGACPFYYNT